MPTCDSMGSLRSIALLPLLLGLGCAHTQRASAEEMEQLLSAAGFTMRLANTPEKMERLRAMDQRVIVAHSLDGGVYYTYADAEGCQCLLAGDQAAYQRFNELAIKKEIAEDQRQAALAYERAAMDWGYWGPWPWWR